MKVTEIRDRAKKLGIKGISKMKKDELILAIQAAEENSDICFGAPWSDDCAQDDCCWREDCEPK